MNEVTAAAERLKRHFAGDDTDEIYPHLSQGYGPLNDQRLLSQAYISVLESEVEQTITREWLAGLGFRFDPKTGEWSNRYVVMIFSGHSQWNTWISGATTSVYLGNICQTRKQLSALMRGLQIQPP